MRVSRKIDGAGMAWGARIAGALLLLCALGLVAWNERRVMDYAAAVNRHGAPVLDLGAAGRPAAGQYGSTTRVSGMPQVFDAPHDREFNVSSDSPVLVRHVEMFQWREITVGGNTHYELDWVDRPIDATGFAKPQGHVNPGAFPVQGRQFEAGEVKLGNFRLASEIVRQFPGRVAVPVTDKALPPNLAATFQAYNGALVTSSKPARPRLGDLRVSWEAVPLQAMTVLARIDGDALVPGKTDQGSEPGFDVQVGERSLLDVIPALPEPPVGVVPVRAVAYLLAIVGALLLASGGRFGRDVLFAVGIGVVVVSAVAGVMWLAGDAMAASVWLLFAVLGAGLAIWRVQQHASRASH
ncbi:TMEM43 family protein [Bacillus sp. NP157]|nr:TMEM43 family protein [Bacillus sp. NP157]